MLKFVPIILFAFVMLSTSEASIGQSDTSLPVKYFSTLSNISIRALEVVSDSKVWFGANHGVWGYTEDAGKTWHIDSMKVDSVYPEFRSIAVLSDSTVLLLSIASPAYIFKTNNKGKTWRLVYKNTNKNIFFDSMKFGDSKNARLNDTRPNDRMVGQEVGQGIAIADPIDGCLQFVITKDGGETWKQIDCANIPKAMKEEALFASSNTCMDVFKNHVWFATGGKQARVFHSADYGNHFEVYDTPIVKGEQLTGIFSIDFADDKTGIIAGGNYSKTDSSAVGLAITQDAGKTWKEIKSKKLLFGSCVQYKSADGFFVTGHDGTFIYNYKTGKIQEVKDKSGSQLKFHTLRFSPSGKTLWLAGDKGRIAFLTFAP